MKTSLKLSKLLKEGGFEMEHNNCWKEDCYRGPSSFTGDWYFKDGNTNEYIKYQEEGFLDGHIYPAYDILNDLCVKYAKEMFGDKEHFGICSVIFTLVKCDDLPSAEDYLWENCLFNPKNVK